MRIWLLRGLMFLLLTLGAAACSIIIYEVSSSREGMPRFIAEHRAETMGNTGRLLLEWWLARDEASAQASEAFLAEHVAHGRSYTLLGPHGEVLAGAQPDDELSAMGSLSSLRSAFLSSEDGRRFPPSGPRGPIREALSFRGRDGSSYTLVLRTDIEALAMPRKPRPLVFIIPGALIAMLVVYGLFRLSRAASGELRTALRRLAQGDYAVRVDTALERRKDSFAELARDFNHTMTTLADKQAQQRYLISEISHEMRSPLTRIAMATELADPTAPERVAQLLARIKVDSDSLHAISEQLLEYVRLQWDAEARQEVSLEELLRPLARESDVEARAQGRKVVFRSQGDCNVRGNPAQLASLCRNLLRNAVRHTAPGTTVELRLEPLARFDGMAPAVRIVVLDHGPGLPEDQLEAVFRPFHQGEGQGEGQAPSGAARGSAGLGLAIVKHVVDSHGGIISLINRQEGGLAANVVLPAHSEEPEEDPVWRLQTRTA